MQREQLVEHFKRQLAGDLIRVQMAINIDTDQLAERLADHTVENGWQDEEPAELGVVTIVGTLTESEPFPA